ncbi:hypothetical protein LJC33_08390 [Eubacteriales bacterium OttesenSCG-928-N13]|nr:hypothetical protein [Eubacteriales bacterium OttesenSCG-928-N13]
MFNDCAQEYGLDKDKPAELNQLINILAQCYFEQLPSGIEAEHDLNEHVGMIFTGNAAITRVLLEQYANDSGKFGVKITAKDVVDYLKARDIHIRNISRDERVLPRISTLNDIYWGVYQPINNKLIHRNEADTIVQKVCEGVSVILHGKAGAGKSGCLQDVIEQLNTAHIPYLALKLDKNAPSSSADAYGIALGLPQSPIFCLNSLSAGKPCVLILDQLDSLRWTSNHSATALDVCKEMILQAEAINQYEDGRVSIIFVSRTFDLENDNGLKSLFSNPNEKLALTWSKVNIGDFSEEDVIQIIGTDYNNFSIRLKKLLQTPSSLFVWTQLDAGARNNGIYSSYQLMDAWWDQVQMRCEGIGIARNDARNCKDSIVNMMETRSIFALPIQLFADYRNIVDKFISSGLLTTDGRILSFTHQSFLDYFISYDSLNRIYCGENIPDIIGPLDNQTPNLRYRILTILQNLIDSDKTMFLVQCDEILKSKCVRYYFKCAVFDTIGQCEEPNEAVLVFVQTYADDSEWADYIFQTVYLGHPAYIMSSSEGFAWMGDKGLSLLRSIGSTQPDFVTTRLRRYVCDCEDDRKIFHALCHNPIDDSEDMFNLRLELFERNPELFNEFWGFSQLVETQSARAIALFRIIVRKSASFKLKITHWGDEKALEKYPRTNHTDIISELFQEICNATTEIVPDPLSHLNIVENYKPWLNDWHDKSPVRKILKLVKTAFEEYVQIDPTTALSFINQINYPISVIGHGIVIHGLLDASTDFSDDVIKWLLADFKNRVFEYTSNSQDYLSYTKKIIKKFSPTCSQVLFEKLEIAICAWKDSKKRMLSTYRNRIEVNRKHDWGAVYYAYWGHFQKELLPFMDYQRLSSYARNLLDVLNRNSWISSPHFYCGFSGGPGKSVVSPIHAYTHKISDKRWLEIIATPNEKMKGHWSGRETDSCYVEATHEMFSSDLSKQARLQPSRFAELSLRFPENCYSRYISSVISALKCEDESTERVEVRLVCDVLRRYIESADHNIAREIARLLEHRAKDSWPEDIIGFLEDLALTHPDPPGNEQRIWRTENPDNCSPHDLLNNSINNVRGCALHAIAALLWKHQELSNRFKNTILRASSDSNDSVRFAVMSCVLPYCNYDFEFSISLFHKLLSSDLRIIAAHRAWEMISRDYHNNPAYYRDVLIAASKSNIGELSERAAELMCAVVIYFEDKELDDQLLSGIYSDKQIDKICRQAARSYNDEEYHARSEKILLHFVDHTKQEIFSLNNLFFDRCISIQRDRDFLIHIMQSRQSVRVVHSFLDYLGKSDENIIEYTDVLEAIGSSLTTMSAEWKRPLVVGDLIKCVIRLFDRGKDDPDVRCICLNIWDNLFISNLYDMKSLSDMIDDFG